MPVGTGRSDGLEAGGTVAAAVGVGAVIPPATRDRDVAEAETCIHRFFVSESENLVAGAAHGGDRVEALIKEVSAHPGLVPDGSPVEAVPAATDRGFASDRFRCASGSRIPVPNFGGRAPGKET